MNDLAITDIGGSVRVPADVVLPCSLAQKHTALSFICAAIGGFIVGLLTSKVLDWISPEPGPGKAPTHHVHDHHHFHHQGSPHLDPVYGKIIG